MSKRKKVTESIRSGVSPAKEKLMHVIASGIVISDELTPEELELLQESEGGLTPEERYAILKEVGDDPYLHMP